MYALQESYAGYLLFHTALVGRQGNVRPDSPAVILSAMLISQSKEHSFAL